MTGESFSSMIESPQQNKRYQVSPRGGFVMRGDFIMIHKTFSSVIESPPDNKRNHASPSSHFTFYFYSHRYKIPNNDKYPYNSFNTNFLSKYHIFSENHYKIRQISVLMFV